MGPHRADIVLLDGRVVEVQHSPIAPKTIIERVRYYGPDMLWIFDARDAWTARDLVIQRVTAATVSWKWLRGIGDRRLVGGAETFFDTGAFLLEPRKGYIVPRVSMCALIAEGTPLPPPDYAYLDSLAEIGNQKWRADMHKQAERVRQQEEDGRRLAEIERKEQEELRLREQKEKEERERWPPCADCGDPESFKCRRDGCAKCCFCRTRREAAEELAASEVQRAAIEMRRASKEQLQQMFVDAVARQTTGPR